MCRHVQTAIPESISLHAEKIGLEKIVQIAWVREAFWDANHCSRTLVLPRLGSA
jgi:hypothetical protein